MTKKSYIPAWTAVPTADKQEPKNTSNSGGCWSLLNLSGLSTSREGCIFEMRKTHLRKGLRLNWHLHIQPPHTTYCPFTANNLLMQKSLLFSPVSENILKAYPVYGKNQQSNRHGMCSHGKATRVSNQTIYPETCEGTLSSGKLTLSSDNQSTEPGPSPLISTGQSPNLD